MLREFQWKPVCPFLTRKSNAGCTTGLPMNLRPLLNGCMRLWECSEVEPVALVFCLICGKFEFEAGKVVAIGHGG